MAEEVAHAIVEMPEPQPEPASIVEPAAAAVALADATAAAAELDAAERMRRFEEGNEQWRGAFQQTLTSELDSLRTSQEAALLSLATQNSELGENFRLLSERQAALEAAYLSSTPPPSEETTTVEETTPIAATAAEIEAGPVSLGASLAAETEPANSNSQSAAAKLRRRHWI